jgi:hypothetical protein
LVRLCINHRILQACEHLLFCSILGIFSHIRI